MKINSLSWAVVSFVVFVTILVPFVKPTTTDGSELCMTVESTPVPGPSVDSNKYALVDYDAPLPQDPTERNARVLKNRRYDNQEFVLSNPHPATARVTCNNESAPSAVFPTNESDLIVTGNILAVSGHLSNDKSGVYSEYTVKIDQVFKKAAAGPGRGGLVTIDRTGGYVRYPSGQKVLYEDETKDMPSVGHCYVLFLKEDKIGKNYEVVTLYELRDATVIPLDSGRSMNEIKSMSVSDFVKAIQEKVSKPGAGDN